MFSLSILLFVVFCVVFEYIKHDQAYVCLLHLSTIYREQATQKKYTSAMLFPLSTARLYVCLMCVRLCTLVFVPSYVCAAYGWFSRIAFLCSLMCWGFELKTVCQTGARDKKKWIRRKRRKRNEEEEEYDDDVVDVDDDDERKQQQQFLQWS